MLPEDAIRRHCGSALLEFNRKSSFQEPGKKYVYKMRNLSLGSLVTTKGIWCVCLALLTFCLASCDNGEDSEESRLYNYLQGKWVTTHVVENEHFTPAGGGDPFVQDIDRDITSETDEYYAVIGFDRNNMCTLYESGSPEDMVELPVSARYRLAGDKLSCPLFYGDFSKHVTVRIISENVMEMTLIDNGTDIDGTTIYNQTITFKRYGSDDGNLDYGDDGQEGDIDDGGGVDYSEYVKGRWVSTHVVADALFTPSDGSEPYRMSTDRDITSETDDSYMVIGFDNYSVCTLYESPLMDDTELPLSERYTIDGNRLSCPLFYGAFTDYVTVRMVSADEMELTLEDNGTDESGTQTYTETVTFRRYYR